MQILASQQTVISRHCSAKTMSIPSEWIRFHTNHINNPCILLYNTYADFLRSLSSSKHCSLLCSHVIWLYVVSIIVFLFGLSSDRFIFLFLLAVAYSCEVNRAFAMIQRNNIHRVPLCRQQHSQLTESWLAMANGTK